MNLQELVIRFVKMEEADDLAGLDRLLTDHPELVASHERAAYLMHGAARGGRTAVVALLVRHGVDINIHETPKVPNRPIDTAAGQGYRDMVRWLVEHGAEINYGFGGGPVYCYALALAVQEGDLDMVRLLVDKGALLNVRDRVGKTPLSWAIAYKRRDIEAYLRSQGALEAHQLPPPPPEPPPESRDAFLDYVDNVWGGEPEPRSWLPAAVDAADVAVRVAFCGDLACVFTRGMSDRPMNVPPGNEAYQYAELVVYLHSWPYDAASWQRPEYAWPVQWLRRLARYPAESGSWLGGKVAVIANGEPPRPLGPGTDLTCWLLLADKEPLARVEAEDGRSMVFYTLIPITTAERDYEKTYGTEALLRKFAERDVPDWVVPHRQSVV
jgi:hypothetical protein